MIPFVCKDNFLTEEENKNLLEYCSSQVLENGQAGNYTENNIRKSLINFLQRNDDTEWLYQKMDTLLNEVNSYYYNFNTINYSGIQYAEYASSYSGKYDWHTDMYFGKDRQNKSRKLSVSVLLNQPGVDFEGGEFQITSSFDEDRMGIEDPKLVKNTAIVFPSFMIHRVKPVTEGTRKSLVIWAEGPSFI